MLALLAACASNQEQVAACKIGNWQAIGEQDGRSGSASNFAERRKFCERRGRSTPNEVAYQAGWQEGNRQYWLSKGEQDGVAGLAERQKDIQQATAIANQLPFNDSAYAQGWLRGNQGFWNMAGRSDGAAGKLPAEFALREQAAKAAGLRTDEAAYRQGWENGLVDYWAQLGQNDAVSGKQFELRKLEAQQRGLKIVEQAYRDAWKNRLLQYWQQAGEQDGWGQQNFLEQRIASAGRDGVFVISETRSLYENAWQAQHQRYCQNDNAFAMGRENKPINVGVCGNERRLILQRAYTAGQDYEAINGKYQRTLSDLKNLSQKREDNERRLRSLEDSARRELNDKNRKPGDDASRRRDSERLEITSNLRQQDRQMEELRRWEERYSQQLRDIKRDAYAN
jgi:Skp family chaperone for outer membrane proteins